MLLILHFTSLQHPIQRTSWVDIAFRAKITSAYDLNVIRIDVPESHDWFCNNKQAEKASLELAVNALIDGVAASVRHLTAFFNNLVKSHRHAAPAASSSSLDNRPSQGQAETKSLLS
ncbi:hypothetical protein PENPOL_c003G07685 [Penicillium polonicum]|uniref:Uncharacterized protein n=1 Tax=Penicillium polonicum TaxID=60169 RepID=A0A1V6NU45_PENPO|nr:hypothetical protein PENPOL_c003G07685 [Penicillium polonicum]